MGAMNVVCAECMEMCCLGGKNSVVKGVITHIHLGRKTCLTRECMTSVGMSWLLALKL